MPITNTLTPTHSATRPGDSHPPPRGYQCDRCDRTIATLWSTTVYAETGRGPELICLPCKRALEAPAQVPCFECGKLIPENVALCGPCGIDLSGRRDEEPF